MMKTILLTGGTGFIGNCFCKLLLEERPEYIVINVDVCTYVANPSTIDGELKKHSYKFLRQVLEKEKQLIIFLKKRNRILWSTLLQKAM